VVKNCVITFRVGKAVLETRLFPLRAAFLACNNPLAYVAYSKELCEKENGKQRRKEDCNVPINRVGVDE
jgi:hypothetical protein